MKAMKAMKAMKTMKKGHTSATACSAAPLHRGFGSSSRLTSGFALAVERAMEAMPKRRSALAMVMTGCLLVGASYALLNTQTHAVGAVAAVGVEDSKVVDLVFAMEDMERGLQEMAQSVEHMQEMLKRSPMVQALAQHKPVVKQIMNDPKKLQEEMALVQRNLAALQKAEQAMRNPYKRQQVMRWADVMLQKVAAVVQDLQDEKKSRGRGGRRRGRRHGGRRHRGVH